MTEPTPPRRCAVIGNPIAHSRSPFIHLRFAEQTGLDLRYDRILAEADDFEAVATDFFHGGGIGLNVTVPFKEKAFTLTHRRLDDSARVAQAVNTLYVREGVLHGANTDGTGLLADLERLGCTLSGKRVLLVGAGGAARGVAAPLLASGCALLHVVNRHAERAHILRQHIHEISPATAGRLSSGGLRDADGDWDLIINATSGSLQGQAPDIPAARYAAGALAYDLVYSARPTPFMIQASRLGADQVSDGLGMLVSQAAASFAIWHGRYPDALPVLAALRQALDAETR
ncbi:MAG TPA: shikimate dehydrogenase [Burkholderiaceae bacterium]|nr:shikimate dehydrogenase [Burkholderiaceae bacterium]